MGPADEDRRDGRAKPASVQGGRIAGYHNAKRRSLRELYMSHRGKVSDKWSSYLPEYDRLFSAYRDRPIRLLEIGVQNGGSLEIWAKYFANAKNIIGCDVDPACAKLEFDDDRISVIIGDANSDAAATAVRRRARALDIIIDDGSHRSGDVVKSFSRYFPLLAYGGLYVIEDLHCSYWKRFDGGLYAPFSSVTFLKRLADIANYQHWGFTASRADVLKGFASEYEIELPEAVLETLHSVELTNSLGIVRKERPDRNRLSKRLIAGSIAGVAPETLHLDPLAPPRSDETENEWAQRAMPPEQELPLRLSELAELRPQLEKRGVELAHLSFHLDAREAQIARLEESAAQDAVRHRHEMQRSKRRLAGLEGELAQTKSALASRNAELGQLSTALGERELQVVRLETDLADIYSSAAWRLTSPLREVRMQARRWLMIAKATALIARTALTQGPRSGLRLMLNHRLLLRSAAFDAEYYLSTYPDVASAAVDPALHYLTCGAHERRNPNSLFDTSWYLEQYPDVATAGTNPLVHYLRSGAAERRDPGPGFGTAAYLLDNRDVAEAGVNPLAHYLALGRAEGRTTRPSSSGSAARSETVATVTSRPLTTDSKPVASVAERLKQAVASPGMHSTNKTRYSDWIALNDTLDDNDRLLIRTHIAALREAPKVSILMRVADPATRRLAETLRSIEGQLYDNWELCAVDDASGSSAVRRLLQAHAEKDPRIKILFRDDAGGYPDCANDALALATGKWIVLVDQEDVLAEHALYMIAQAVEANDGVDLLYSDSDELSPTGARSNPHFKPDCDYDQLLGHNYIGRLAAYRTSLARDLGGFDPKAATFHDWDLSLRVLENGSPRRVLHLPFILYHRRRPHTSIEGWSHSERASAMHIIGSHLSRASESAEVIPVERGAYLRIKRELPPERPLVSVVIPTRDQYRLLRTCIEGLLNRTSYSPIELVVVDNGSTEPDAVQFLASLETRQEVKVVRDPRPFNFARLTNLGVAGSSGSICIFLNNDVDAINSDWLDELVSHALRPEVGAVGAKLYYANDTLQHGGVVLGIYNASGSVAGHIHRGAPRSAAGYLNRLALTAEVSAVTAACMAIRRDVFEEVGGLNERDLAVSFNDVDLCLRIRKLGYSIVWTPHAELYHYESVSRGGPRETPDKAARNDAERGYMRRHWAADLDGDPFYNPNLSLESPSFELSIASRAHMPWWSFEMPPDNPIEQDVAAALLNAGGRRATLSVTQRLAHPDGIARQISSYRTDRRRLSAQQDPKVAVYTAIAAAYDSMKLPQALDPRYEYVLFTDRPMPDTGPWRVEPITFHDADPTRAGRYVKTHPTALLPGYDVAVWVDSNIMILGDLSPLVDSFLESGKPVAAVPHPMRRSVYEELDACLQFKTDDARTMMDQLKSYREAGFSHDDLIESNFLMFDMRSKDIGGFLARWWSEIERHSRRDQLSINYSLDQTGVPWHRLTKFPNSIRNHRQFAFIGHDAGKGPSQQLVDALGASLVDPYSGVSYGSVRAERVAQQRDRRVDVVVCVHNALPDVQACLDSVKRHRTQPNQRLIIIDDGSDPPTTEYLRAFADDLPWVLMERNERPHGYTTAANQGLRASDGELVVLLNSDTIVTEGWTEKLADALFSTAGAGIVGPLSNAASYQSIPEYRSGRDQTAINEIPPSLTIEDLNRYCEQWTLLDILPRVPLIHGFCFGISRKALDAVGLLDDVNFPRGYGEENDYCFRAIDAGFGLVVATHTFVYHAKSRSYAGPDRVRLTKEGAETLNRLYGERRVARAVRTMETHPLLVSVRDQARSLASTLKLSRPA
jgi:GT2 family glycosyltransferase